MSKFSDTPDEGDVVSHDNKTFIVFRNSNGLLTLKSVCGKTPASVVVPYYQVTLLKKTRHIKNVKNTKENIWEEKLKL